MTKNISDYLDDAYQALAAAEQLADDLGESFSFSASYGMGGNYYPKKTIMTKEEAIDLLRGGSELSLEIRTKIAKVLAEDDDDRYHSEGWVSSSQSC